MCPHHLVLLFVNFPSKIFIFKVVSTVSDKTVLFYVNNLFQWRAQKHIVNFFVFWSYLSFFVC
jgi:hypothetical protein